jgi:hypothetical protein
MLLVVLAVAASGCSACAGSPGAPAGRGASASGSPSGASASATDVEETSASSSSASSSGESRGPAPVVAIRGTVERGREVALAIENRGTTLARIAPRAALEREVEGRFRAVEAITVELRADCATAPPECVVLAPGAAFLPATWHGAASGTQCDARDALAGDHRAAAEPGVYRVVARTCEGGHRIEGEPFEITR